MYQRQLCYHSDGGQIEKAGLVCNWSNELFECWIVVMDVVGPDTGASGTNYDSGTGCSTQGGKVGLGIMRKSCDLSR